MASRAAAAAAMIDDDGKIEEAIVVSTPQS